MENLTQKDFERALEISRIVSSDLDIFTIKTNLLNLIAGIIPSESITIYMFDDKKQKFFHPITTGLSSEFCQKFENIYYKFDSLVRYMLRSPEIFLSTNIISNLSFERSILYEELYNPERVFYILTVPIHIEGKLLGSICFTRPKHGKNFSMREVSIMELLQPHIRNSFKNAILFDGVTKQKDLFKWGFNNLYHGVLIFDMDFELIYSNETAEDFFREYIKKFPGVEKTHSLSLEKEKDFRIPKIIYDDFTRLKEGFFHPEKTLEYPPREMLVQMSPFEKYSIKSLVIRKEECLEKTSCYLIIIEDISQNKIPNYENLKQKYRLTNREIEIIKLLLRGYKNIELADKLSISEETVKVHIKNIFDKMGIKRRMSIVPLILENKLT